MPNEKPIPEEIARKICRDIREEKGVKLFSQCWGCVRFSKGDPKKMCFYKPPDFRGCNIVNKRYDKEDLTKKE
jgi:hypothetical protein